jgi:hypothetical protein
MRAWLPIARLSRQSLAVAALYAFLLGTYLGALAPAPPSFALHVLCSPSGDAGSVPAGPAADHRDCCTPACPGGSASLAPPASEPLAPPGRSIGTLAWTEAPGQAPRAASLRDTRARDPPHA